MNKPAPGVWRVAPAVLLLALAGMCAAADSPAPDKREAALFLALARLARTSYDDDAEGIVATPSGCVALVREDAKGNLFVAFRGSMLADRDPGRKPFSNLGGRIARRNYRDWVATNLKQVAGFLPRQYVEAAELLIEQVRLHPGARHVYVTGHSKGGGAAEYAAVNAWLSRDRIPFPPTTTVTFNAAVVREGNWRRLYREHGEDAVLRLRRGDAPVVVAVVMRGDPVSKISRDERPLFSRLVELTPTGAPAPGEQHGIDAVIAELELLRQ